MWRQNLGKKANWMPASNVFTIPGAGKNKYPGKAQEAETREEGGGGKAERRLRAEMRAGTFGGGPEADQGWEDLLLGLEGVGGAGGGLDRETEHKQYLEMRRKVEDQVLFPDEVDTPLNVTVQDRYRKYAAVGDIERHVWDYTADLPGSYKQLYQFDNLKRTFRKARWEVETLRREAFAGSVTAARPGQMVRLLLINVTRSQAEAARAVLARGAPLVSSYLRALGAAWSVLLNDRSRVEQTGSVGNVAA